MPPSPALQAISESAVQSHEADEKYGDAMNWDELEFAVIPTDYMFIMKCSNGDNFSQGHLAPYGKIELSPFSGILNYGQGVLEGLKAIRTKDGCVQLFRPEENALRMKMSAERLCMPSPSTHQFLDALKQTVLANKRWVEERDVPLEDVLAADEVFCTGTAVEVTAVASITHQDKRIEYRTGEETVFHKLRVVLKGIQTGVIEDKMGWTMLID
ncbi:unnamed protein product [Prunus armeniaca]